MAIAIYIPPEYGPMPPGQNQGQQQQQNQGVSPEPEQQQQTPHHDNPVAAGPSSSSSSSSQSDNLNPNRRDVREARSSNVPDVITCQAGLTVRYRSSDLVLNNQNENAEAPPSSSYDDHVGPCPLSPRSNQMPVTFDFEVGLKMEMCMGTEALDDDNELELPAHFEDLTLEDKQRVIGQRLRRISREWDEIHTIRPKPTTAFKAVELKLAISFAIPAAALVALGLAYLKSRS